MPLRNQLTWLYTGLLSSVILLLAIVIYGTYSFMMTRSLDRRLQWAAQRILDEFPAVLSSSDTDTTVNLPNSYHFQIWSRDGQLITYSENMDEVSEALDPSALLETKQVNRSVKIEYEPYRILSSPIALNEQNTVILQVGLTMQTLQESQRFLVLALVISALILVLLSWYISWNRLGKFLEPLKQMSEIADTITNTNDLSRRIPLNSKRNDETTHLVLIFNNTLARLERLFNSQRRFLADVTHELRTPLTVIKGNVGLMRMMKKYDDESLTSIEIEVDRLTRLVGDLLLMTQAETGKLPLFFEIVEVDGLLFDVFEQMKVLSKGQHDIRIGSIEPAIVTGDRDRLKQVLLNLGSNAIKYSPAGTKIFLSLSLKDKWVLVNVSDEGRGIPKEELKFIFERFYRGDKSRSRSRESGGYGLGLPIAYWIIHNHGGRIEVESEVGKGTTFTVWLPISQTDVPTRPLRPMKKE